MFSIDYLERWSREDCQVAPVQGIQHITSQCNVGGKRVSPVYFMYKNHFLLHCNTLHLTVTNSGEYGLHFVQEQFIIQTYPVFVPGCLSEIHALCQLALQYIEA